NQSTSQPKLQDSIDNDQNNLTKTYQDAFHRISATFLDLPTIFNDSYNVLHGNTLNGSCKPDSCNYPNMVDLGSRDLITSLVAGSEINLSTASVSYHADFDDYSAVLYNSSQDKIDQSLSETINSAQLISQTIKSEQIILNTLVQNLQTVNHSTIPAPITAYQN